MPNKPGFSFIEIIVGILLLAVLGGLVLPNIFRKNEDKLTRTFINDFAMMLQTAVTTAMQEDKVVQVYVDVPQELIMLKIQDPANRNPSIHEHFIDLEKSHSKVILPNWLHIQNFYIQNNDEVQSGRALQKVWFYAMPDGTVQPVIINFTNEHPDLLHDKKLSIIVNPFLGHVSTFYEFKQP